MELFTKELTQDECKRIWLKDKNTMNDVQQAIQQVRKVYDDGSKKSKMKMWLKNCASRVVYYGNIMDVLVQGCPDYASFLWGALKFLFIVCLSQLPLRVLTR